MSRRFRAFLAAVAVLLPAAPAMAQAPLQPDAVCSAAGAQAVVLSAVIDGATLRLADGAVVMLAGVDVPRGLAGENTGAAEAARAELARIVGDTGASLSLVPGDRDRHGRLIGQIFDASGRLIQVQMVASGYARVRPYPYPIACTVELLELEEGARQAGKGLWRKDFAVFAANDPSLIGRKGLYVLVEGFVLSVGQGNRVDFLNFGRFWQRDFTVMVSAPVAARLAETGLDTAALAKRRVRVRGVVEESGGPSIRLNDFREIEILDDD